MFIEKIPVESKVAYLKKVVDDKFNINKDSNDQAYLRPAQVSDHVMDILNQNRVPEIINELVKKNIFFGLYENYSELMWGSKYKNQFAVVAAFGDTTIKVGKARLGDRCMGRLPVGYLSEDEDTLLNIISAFEIVYKYQAELNNHASVVNANYVNEFMLPNLRALDKKQGTHLVADYKAALNNLLFAKKKHLALPNIFTKKKHLAIPNTQEQQDVLLGNYLGLEK